MFLAIKTFSSALQEGFLPGQERALMSTEEKNVSHTHGRWCGVVCFYTLKVRWSSLSFAHQFFDISLAWKFVSSNLRCVLRIFDRNLFEFSCGRYKCSFEKSAMFWGKFARTKADFRRNLLSLLLHSTVQYCAKRMQTNFLKIRLLFPQNIVDISSEESWFIGRYFKENSLSDTKIC